MEKNSRTIRVISRSGFVVYAALAPVPQTYRWYMVSKQCLTG